MKALLAVILLAGAYAGFTARPVVDDLAFYRSETCDRAPLPDRDGYYRPIGPVCRLADWWVYRQPEGFLLVDR